MVNSQEGRCLINNNRRAEQTHTGNVIEIRAVEDCIRATRKYKEYIGSMRYRHPVQGGDFPSEKFTKYYEVYPDMEVSLDMPINDAVYWLAGDTIIIKVVFTYDYRKNIGSFEIRNGAVKELEQSIPGFRELFEKLGKLPQNVG